MKVLETRRGEEGFKVRTILDDDGTTREKTIEVPLRLWEQTKRYARYRAGKFDYKQAAENGASRANRKARGVQMIREGIKPIAIANELQITTRTVERWRKELNV